MTFQKRKSDPDPLLDRNHRIPFGCDGPRCACPQSPVFLCTQSNEQPKGADRESSAQQRLRLRKHSPMEPQIHYRCFRLLSENELIRLFAFATSFERWPHVRSFGACCSSHRRKALSNHLPPASPASSSIQICENPSDAQLPPWRVSRLRVGAQNQSRPAGCVSRSV